MFPFPKMNGFKIIMELRLSIPADPSTCCMCLSPRTNIHTQVLPSAKTALVQVFRRQCYSRISQLGTSFPHAVQNSVLVSGCPHHRLSSQMNSPQGNTCEPSVTAGELFIPHTNCNNLIRTRMYEIVGLGLGDISATYFRAEIGHYKLRSVC